MTAEAEQLIQEALRKVSLSGSFSPIDIGASAGLSRPQAEAAARALSNAGILVLGFDMSAHFSPDYRKLRAADDRGAGKKKARARKAKPRATPASAARA